VVLGFELTLSHSTSPFLWRVFFLRLGPVDYLPGLASNHDLPDLCFWSRLDYKCEPLAPDIQHRSITWSQRTCVSSLTENDPIENALDIFVMGKFSTGVDSVLVSHREEFRQDVKL
jgi:hypothetical protein